MKYIYNNTFQSFVTVQWDGWQDDLSNIETFDLFLWYLYSESSNPLKQKYLVSQTTVKSPEVKNNFEKTTVI